MFGELIVNGQVPCNCDTYYSGASPGYGMYCVIMIGMSNTCFPYSSQCPSIYGQPLTNCVAPTKAPTLPTNRPTYPTKSPTNPTSSPTIFSTTCKCDSYVSGANPTDDAYFVVPQGSKQYCYPLQCSSGYTYNAYPCFRERSTLQPTSSPSSSKCRCTYYLDGAASGQQSYCVQHFGEHQLCFPYQTKCQMLNGLPSFPCSGPTLKPTLAPTLNPTPKPETANSTSATILPTNTTKKVNSP